MSPIRQNHYVLAVHDLRRSAEFYVNVLGFRVVHEPPGWIFVEKDSCMIMLGECPGDLPASDLGCHSYFAYSAFLTLTVGIVMSGPMKAQSYRT